MSVPSMKLFNRDPSTGLDQQIPLGGCPVYSSDLIQIENNSQLFGVGSILRGFSVILSGCLIDQINTTTKKCNITAGRVLIDDIVYNVEAITNQTYPFSIKPDGSPIIDSRKFKNSIITDVALTYNYTIRTSFLPNTDPNNEYPILDWSEIYFDPFSLQRVEYVLNLLENEGSTKVRDARAERPLYDPITETETGNSIVGSPLFVRSANGLLKWKYWNHTYDYNLGSTPLSFGLVDYINGSTYNGLTGSNSTTLVANQLPAHSHLFNNIYFSNPLPNRPYTETLNGTNLNGTLQGANSIGTTNTADSVPDNTYTIVYDSSLNAISVQQPIINNPAQKQFYLLRVSSLANPATFGVYSGFYQFWNGATAQIKFNNM